MRSLALAALAACGNAASIPQPAPSNVTSNTDLGADGAFAAAVALDYDAPRDVTSRNALRARAVLEYLARCDRGDARSCWRAGMVGAFDAVVSHRSAISTGKNCLAGDQASCNAIEYLKLWLIADDNDRRDDHEARALCSQGLPVACYEVADDGKNTDWSLARQACDSGDPEACTLVSYREPAFKARALTAARQQCARGIARGCRKAGENDPTMLARAAILARRLCALGLIDECGSRPGADDTGALKQRCDAHGWDCTELADMLTDPDAKRDALEQGCQRRVFKPCLELLRGYADHRYREPVAHRARDLAAFLCEVLQRNDTLTFGDFPGDEEFRKQFCR